MKYTDSYIHLNHLRIFAYHGVLPQEKKVGAAFILSLQVRVPLAQAAQSDELTDTVSYAAIYQVVCEEMKVSSQLLEHVAGRICQRLYRDFPLIEGVDITIEKENAPIGTGAQAEAGITLHTLR